MTSTQAARLQPRPRALIMSRRANRGDVVVPTVLALQRAEYTGGSCGPNPFLSGDECAVTAVDGREGLVHVSLRAMREIGGWVEGQASPDATPAA